MSGQLTLFYRVLPCSGRTGARDRAKSGPYATRRATNLSHPQHSRKPKAHARPPRQNSPNINQNNTLTINALARRTVPVPVRPAPEPISCATSWALNWPGDAGTPGYRADLLPPRYAQELDGRGGQDLAARASWRTRRPAPAANRLHVASAGPAAVLKPGGQTGTQIAGSASADPPVRGGRGQPKQSVATATFAALRGDLVPATRRAGHGFRSGPGSGAHRCAACAGSGSVSVPPAAG